MRSLWLFSLACLLLAAQAIQLPNIEEPEEDILDELADDEDVDLKRMLGDLFDDEEIDEDDDDDEEVTGRQLATVTGSEQERLNTFIDVVLAQLKQQAKRDLEPLKFTLTKPKKNKKNGKKKQRKNNNKTKKEKKDDKDEKKNKRNSKDIELPVFRDTEEDLHQIQKRQAETEEEVTSRLDNEDDKEIENEKKNKKWRKNNGNKNNNKKNKNNKKQRKSNNKVVLHGLSHIAREGDVKRYDMKKGTALRTEFTIGPVELDVTRKINDEEHKAVASADKLDGILLIKINKKGNPRVKKLKLNRPKQIKATGSIARGFGGNDGGGGGIFKKSIKQVSPYAVKRLLKAVKEIIQSV